MILGGLWGFKNADSPNLAKRIFKRIVNRKTAYKYNPSFQNKKGFDQFFLADRIWSITKNNATVHDSYLCTSLGGDSFPSKRIGSCFVGNQNKDSNCELDNSSFHICPRECRPKDHQDWLFC
jgi:hypothetical protein